MNLNKAIELNTDFLRPLEYMKDTDAYKALMLGIEALRRHKELSLQAPHLPYPRLHGEEKD